MPKMSRKRLQHMRRMQQLSQLRRTKRLEGSEDPDKNEGDEDAEANDNPIPNDGHEHVPQQGQVEPPLGEVEEVQIISDSSDEGEGRHMEGEVAVSIDQLQKMDKARVVPGSVYKNKLKRMSKKKPKLPPTPIKLRPRPPFPSPSFCFVCVEPTSMAENTRPMVSEADYTCMLKDLLELPRNQSQHYLEQMGDPRLWIGLCGKCLPVIREATRVREEIAKLELTMKKCQQQIVKKMKATELNSFNGDKKVNPFGEGRREQRLAVENILRFVYSHKYSRGRPSVPAHKKVYPPRPNPEIKSCLLSAATSSAPTRTSIPGVTGQKLKARILQKPRLRLLDGADSTVGSRGHANPDMKVPLLSTSISVQQLPPPSSVIPVSVDPDVDMKPPPEDPIKDPLSLDDDIVEIPKPKPLKKTYSAPSPAPTSVVRPSSSSVKPSKSIPAKAKLVHYYGCDECDEDDDTIYTSKYQLELHKYNVHWKSSHIKAKPKREKVVTVAACKNVKTPVPAPGKKDMLSEISDSSESEDEAELVTVKKTGYDCPHCPEVVNADISRYAAHLLVHQEKPYNCSACPELLPAEEDLRDQHWNDKHPSAVLPSLYDLESTKLPEKFRKLKLNPGNIWKCDGCYMGFLTEDAREYHERTCSILIKRAKRGQRSSALLDPTHICPICKFSSRNLEEWRLHRVIHHPEVDRLSCQYCDESFTMKTPEGVEVRDGYKMGDHVKTHLGEVVRSFKRAVTFQKDSKGRIKLTQTQLEEVASQPVRYGYDCPTCPEVKDYDINRYAQHLAIHQRNPIKCSICSAFLPANEDAQEQHWRDKHSSVEFPSASTCATPPEKFTRMILDPGEIWKCEGCSRGFVSDEARTSHEKTSCTLNPGLEFSTPHSCSICKVPSRNMDEWRLHRVLHHPEVDRFCCLFCDESFAEKTVEGVEIRDDEKMMDHIRKDAKVEVAFGGDAKKHGGSLGRVFEECERCGLVFKFNAETKEHFQNAHGIATGGRIYPCPVCAEVFPKKLSMRRHLNNRHFRKHQSMCDICGMSYSQLKSMTEHKFSEHGIRPEGRKMYTCPVEGCKFEALVTSRLHVHSQSVHGAPRKFACRHCGKTFMKTTHRKEHERRHENKLKKPFQCEICGNSFAIKNYLYIHKRLSHEGRTFPSTNKKKGPPTGTKPRVEALSEIKPQDQPQ